MVFKYKKCQETPDKKIHICYNPIKKRKSKKVKNYVFAAKKKKSKKLCVCSYKCILDFLPR